eukprot:scaffold301702_cov35-Attheya_sp.AAC.1
MGTKILPILVVVQLQVRQSLTAGRLAIIRWGSSKKQIGLLLNFCTWSKRRLLPQACESRTFKFY